ncbi:MAG: hypothetical protein JJV93_02480 [Alphaproteobacteria bacterium]|nr:hypothetical protein [Alphaproteobacteria bacterium]MBL0718098.1 hypothetical protein [Alphaproteobacteria bacterium]
MFYINRNSKNKITSITSIPSYKGQERLREDCSEVKEFFNPVKTWQENRQEAYGDTGQQLDILIKNGVEALKEFRIAIKTRFPKDEEDIKTSIENSQIES